VISRAAKHLFSRYLRKLPLLEVPACISHLLNCFLGYKYNASPLQQSPDDSDVPSSEWTSLTCDLMREQITREVFKRFRYRLNDEWWSQCRSIMLLREVCIKMGFQLKAREYIFEKADCASKPKKTNGSNGVKIEETTFYPEDILNVVPIVKDAPFKVCLYLHYLTCRVRSLTKP
jgi:protein TIF31